LTTKSTTLEPADSISKPNSRRFLPLILLAVLGVAYLGYNAYKASRPYEWSGTVEARTIAVGSRTGGRVKDVLVHEGDRVKAGQPLIVFETGDLEAQRLAAQGQFDQVQANLEKLEKGARPEEIEQAKARASTLGAALAQTKVGPRSEQIAGARARLTAAQVAADKALIDAGRARKLFDSQAISQADVDNTDSALKGATAQRDALKQSLAELENGASREELLQAQARAAEANASARLVQAGSRVEDIKAARGMVEAAQGKLDAMKVMLDELTVKAPRDARVESLDLRPGDLVSPSAPAATLLEEDQLYVRIYVPETHIGQLHLGQEIPVSVDSFKNRGFKGVVEHINSVGEFSPRNLQTADERADQVFAARIGLREGKEELRAGMAAFITVPK
jgi:HlyD family secretion protein